MKPRLLFLSHDASRSGAPMFLLHLLRWLKDNRDWEIEVLPLRRGPLEQDFAELGVSPPFTGAARRVQTLAAARRWWLRQETPLPPRAVRMMHRFLNSSERLAARHLAGQLRHVAPYDLIYANSAATAATVRVLARLRCPILTHVHELEYALHMLRDDLPPLWRHSSRYIAAAHAVKANLVERHALNAGNIEVIHECVPSEHASKYFEAARRRVRDQLKIPHDAFVVVASGGFEWRKGSDLWVPLAQAMRGQKQTPIYFLWLGGRLESVAGREMQRDIAHSGLQKLMFLPGAQPNALEYFAAGDVFALLSREDPFPLACLEAAALSKPILCFAGAGGMPEFVGHDAGFTVPYLDISAMAAKVLQLHDEPELRRRMGERAATKVRERHSVAATAPRVAEAIQVAISIS